MLGTIYVISWVLLTVSVLVRPALLLRPTVWFCLAMMVLINGAAAFAHTSGDYGSLDAGYPCAWHLRLSTLLFPLALLGWVAATPRLTALARTLYQNCRAADRLPERFGKPEAVTAAWLALAVAAALTAYFLAVAPQDTGLAAIVFDPADATLARERSLKLVDSGLVRYAYSLHCSLVAPVAAALLILRRPRTPLGQVLGWLLLAGLFASVMLTGARAAAGTLLVSLGCVLMLRRGVWRALPWMAVVVAAALTVALGLTVARESAKRRISLETIGRDFVPAVAERALVTPYLTGVWTNRFAHEHGLLGFSNIRPPALLLGIEHVNLPNRVGLAYVPNPVPSISANTCFLFDFQASFGMAGGWGAALAALCGLDFLLYAFRRLNGSILVACLAAFMAAQMSLTSSGFTVCLVTHGILPAAALAMVLGTVWRVRLAARDLRRIGPRQNWMPALRAVVGGAGQGKGAPCASST